MNKRIQKKIEKRNRIDNRSQSLKDAASNKDNVEDAKRRLADSLNELSETIKEVKDNENNKSVDDMKKLKEEQSKKVVDDIKKLEEQAE